MEAVLSGLFQGFLNTTTLNPIANGMISTLMGLYLAQPPTPWPKDAAPEILSRNSSNLDYDFIIVGAGSAGATVAARLAEITSWKILLLEAGGDPLVITDIPALFYSALQTVNDWDYRTESNPKYCQGTINRQCVWPRGRALGGSSTINGNAYIRGVAQDYEEWRELGNPGWGYNAALRYFKKSENLTYPPIANDPALREFHGFNGELCVTNFKSDSVLKNLLWKAMESAGQKNLTDITGSENVGFTNLLGTIKDGKRWSTAKAFLLKERDNLNIVKNAFVTKLLFNTDKRAVVGVEVKIGSKTLEIRSKKEVIVCAGAINTPKLLMLSGIGNRRHLERLGIKVIAHLPVGKNLKDHVEIPVFLSINNFPSTKETLESAFNYLKTYFVFGQGPLAGVGLNEAMNFVNTVDNSSIPDIQLGKGYTSANDTVFFPSYIKAHDFGPEVEGLLTEIIRKSDMIHISPAVLKPKSKGEILLRSADPFEDPLIYPNYFEDDEDMQTLLRGIRFVEKLEKTKEFILAGLRIERINIKECLPYVFKSDKYWRCLIKYLSLTQYHPTCTARMGPSGDMNSVVNPRLVVHGMKGVRVIDASVMPDIVRGNTNAPTIMIAEHGADIIKQDWARN